MKSVYLRIEIIFEKLVSIATIVLGNSIAFIAAFLLVFYWWSTNLFTSHHPHQDIGDIIFGITFLSLFIIQKSFNRYSALIHLKMNELISSHETANNSVINTSQKTEQEIRELSKEYLEAEVELEKEMEEIIKEDHAENKI